MRRITTATVIWAGALLFLTGASHAEDSFLGLGLRGYTNTDLDERTQELDWMLKVRVSSIKNSPEYSESETFTNRDQLVQFITQMVQEEQAFLESLKSMGTQERRWALEQFEPIQKQEILAFGTEQKDEGAPSVIKANDLAWLTGSWTLSAGGGFRPIHLQELDEPDSYPVRSVAMGPAPLADNLAPGGMTNTLPPEVIPMAGAAAYPAPVVFVAPYRVYHTHPRYYVRQNAVYAPLPDRTAVGTITTGLQSVPFRSGHHPYYAGQY